MKRILRMMPRPADLMAALAACVLIGGCDSSGTGREPEQLVAEAPELEPVWCHAELRSWVVAGRGRHLYLQITCPEPYGYLDGRVEFGETDFRPGYIEPEDFARRNRVGKTPRGMRQSPPYVPADNRIEGRYELTLEQVACLQTDRIWSRGYVLVGSNSNSAMREVLSACDCEVPRHILEGYGVLGEFPGIDQSPGDEVPAERWAEFGLPEGPEPLPEPTDSPADVRK